MRTFFGIILAFSVLTTVLSQGTKAQTTIIRAGGSSFGGALYGQWISAYNGLPKWSGSAQMHYRSSDSTIGNQMFLNGTFMFSGSDSELSAINSSLINPESIIKIPAVAGAIVLAYNIPELADFRDVYLNVSREIAADIFLGKVTKWNDPVLQALNPTIQMPNETINIVVRRDRSSTTYKFTDALSKFSSEFRTQIGASSLPPWIIQHYNASGNGGVARAIHGFDYSIGYVGVASAYENHVPYATFINRAGKYVRANYQNIDSTISNLSASTVASLGTLNGDLDLNDISGADTYPIVGMTYYMLNRTVEQDKCELSRQTARYLHWTYTSQTAADIAHHLSFSVMHGKLLEAVLESLKSLSCRTPEKNVTLWAQSVCDNGCEHGSCRFDFGFQPATEVCNCELGFKNQKLQNCSEEVVAVIMDATNPLALFILILTSILIVITLAIIGFVIKYRNNHIIKSASPLFCILSLFGVLFAYVDVYLYIGQPTDAVCAFRPVTVSFASAIFFGTMLPKTFRIYKVFRRIRALRSSISNRRLLLQSGVIVAINVLFIIIWYSIDVPRVLAIPGADEKKFICASKNTTVDIAFNDIMLIYHGLLIAATTFLAVKVRVARDVFNEAVSIGVSVYGVTTVAIFFVPVSFISSINTQTFFLLRTLASIICATTVLGALFVPKVIAILRPAQLNGKPSDVASSTSPSKRPSQIASSVMSVQTVIQAEYYFCEFYLKKNGLFAVWKPVKITMVPLKDTPGSGLLSFHDSSDSSIIFQTLRIQDTKLICDESLRSSGHSAGNSSGGNSENGQNPNGNPSNGAPNFARLMFADGYYDLEGKSSMAMATLLKLYAVPPAVLTKGRKQSEMTSTIQKAEAGKENFY